MASNPTARRVGRPRPTRGFSARWQDAKIEGRGWHGGWMLELFLRASKEQLQRWPHVYLLAPRMSYDDSEWSSVLDGADHQKWDRLEASSSQHFTLSKDDAFQQAQMIQERLRWMIGGLMALDPSGPRGGLAVPSSPGEAWAWWAMLYSFGLHDTLEFGGKKLPSSRNKKVEAPLTFLSYQVIATTPRLWPRVCECEDPAHKKHRSEVCGTFFRAQRSRAQRCKACRT